MNKASSSEHLWWCSHGLHSVGGRNFHYPFLGPDQTFLQYSTSGVGLDAPAHFKFSSFPFPPSTQTCLPSLSFLPEEPLEDPLQKGLQRVFYFKVQLLENDFILRNPWKIIIPSTWTRFSAVFLSKSEDTVALAFCWELCCWASALAGIARTAVWLFFLICGTLVRADAGFAVFFWLGTRLPPVSVDSYLSSLLSHVPPGVAASLSCQLLSSWTFPRPFSAVFHPFNSLFSCNSVLRCWCFLFHLFCFWDRVST